MSVRAPLSLTRRVADAWLLLHRRPSLSFVFSLLFLSLKHSNYSQPFYAFLFFFQLVRAVAHLVVTMDI
jgi:hypothetical protein